MQSGATWSWEQRGSGHQNDPPTIEKIKEATCLGRYSYGQAPVVNPCFLLSSELTEDFYAYELFATPRQIWAAKCGRMTDNKETYKLSIGDRI